MPIKVSQPEVANRIEKCQEPLSLAMQDRKAFDDRQAKLVTSDRWPHCDWYDDEEFCRAYNTAMALSAEVAELRRLRTATDAGRDRRDKAIREQDAEIVQLKNALRARDGCCMLSDGAACNCELCERDSKIAKLLEKLKLIERALTADSEI